MQSLATFSVAARPLAGFSPLEPVSQLISRAENGGADAGLEPVYIRDIRSMHSGLGRQCIFTTKAHGVGSSISRQRCYSGSARQVSPGPHLEMSLDSGMRCPHSRQLNRVADSQTLGLSSCYQRSRPAAHERARGKSASIFARMPLGSCSITRIRCHISGGLHREQAGGHTCYADRLAAGAAPGALSAELEECSIQVAPPGTFSELGLSCTTFNILAPIYKRVAGEGVRESHFKSEWLARNEGILSLLLSEESSIICLQEFWMENDDLMDLYVGRLSSEGYDTYILPRTNNRGDGLLTAVKHADLEVLDSRELLFNDCGDRVAQLLRVRARRQLADPHAPPVEMLLVNTHLLFPHNANSSLIRLRQVYKILEYLEQYKTLNRLPPMPIILCGDWNGSKRGQVYKFLRSQGFVSSYDLARDHEDADAHCWVSHRNHRGNICGVDFIWLLNPTAEPHLLTADWKAAIFAMIKAKLHAAGLEEREAFDFFQVREEGDDEHISFSEFQAAMDHLGLTGEGSVGLTTEEMRELMASADRDGNGLIDYEEFQVATSAAPALSGPYPRGAGSPSVLWDKARGGGKGKEVSTAPMRRPRPPGSPRLEQPSGCPKAVRSTDQSHEARPLVLLYVLKKKKNDGYLIVIQGLCLHELSLPLWRALSGGAAASWPP